MKNEFCFIVSFYADFLPPSILLVLAFLSHNQWAIAIVGCIVLAYIFLIIPIKVCFTPETIVITTLTRFRKKTINLNVVQSLKIIKSAQPSIPLQFIIFFNTKNGKKSQSFGVNQERKIVEIIKIFLRNKILIESDGHGMIEYYMRLAIDELN